MSACPIDYRQEKFTEMGFDQMQSLVLANTKDKDGVPLYWFDVRELVKAVGLVKAYDVLA